MVTIMTPPIDAHDTLFETIKSLFTRLADEPTWSLPEKAMGLTKETAFGDDEFADEIYARPEYNAEINERRDDDIIADIAYEAWLPGAVERVSESQSDAARLIRWVESVNNGSANLEMLTLDTEGIEITLCLLAYIFGVITCGENGTEYYFITRDPISAGLYWTLDLILRQRHDVRHSQYRCILLPPGDNDIRSITDLFNKIPESGLLILKDESPSSY